MKQIKSWSLVFGAGAIALMGVAGCADRNKNGEPDSPATTSEIDKSLQGAGNSVAATAGKAGDVASNAAAGAANTVKGAAGAVVDASQTPDIKAAFGANRAMDGSKIDVTTKDKTVTLTGTVKSPAQKNMAAQIAKQKAGANYKIVNNLKVGK